MKIRTPELEERWQQRYRISEVLWTKIASKAPRRGLAASNRTGVMQLYAWDVPSGNMHQLTDYPTGKMFATMDAEGKYIYHLKDEGSNEIGHYVRVPFKGGAEQDITPDMTPYASQSIAIASSMRRLVLVAAARDGFKIYALDLDKQGSTSKPRLLYVSKALLNSLVISQDGGIVVGDSTELSGKLYTNLLAVDTENGQKIAELWDGDETSLKGVAFSPLPGDLRLLATTNISGFTRPLLWNPASGERQDLVLDILEGDVEPYDWSPDGRYLLLSNIHQAEQQLYLYDLEANKLVKLDHPAGSYFSFSGIGTYFTPGGEIYASWQNATHPHQLIALDRKNGHQKHVVIQADPVPAGHVWKSVTFPSSDGTTIQAWLSLPEGDGSFPTILHTHGGPTGVMNESFSASAQAWVDHGFAFLTVNYRGSTTFGKDFQNQIVGDLGHWEVEDVHAALDWLIANGISERGRILKTGYSYGGYMTLMCMGRLPEYFAGGMAGIAIADWNLMYENQAPTLRGYQVALFGGTPETKGEQYRISSPITYLENVKAPILLIQGRNDTRCPMRQMEAYLNRAEELHKDIRIEWFDAGHGSMRVEESIQHQKLMIDFAYEVLGAA